MMHICSGLVGPKTRNVEEVMVFQCFFEGSKGALGAPTGRSTKRAGVVLGGKTDQKTSKKKKTEPLDMRWQA